MATIPKTGIATGQNITATQITNIIDALDGTTQTDISMSAGSVLSIPGFPNVATSLAAAGGSAFSAAGISGSLGTNATLIRSLTAPIISGSFNAASSSFSTRVTNLKTDSGSFSTRVTSIETNSTFTKVGISGSVLGASNIATLPSTANFGPLTGRLVSGVNGDITGISNTDKAYFYGNSGVDALNIGISSNDADFANNRIKFTTDTTTSDLILRGKNAANTQTSASFTNFSTYTSLSAGNVGSSFFINNNFNTTNNIQFGNTKTANGKMTLYLAGNSDSSRPGSSGASRGGLLVTHTLELGGAKGYKSSGTTWDTTSDHRLKENIITASLDICYDVIKNIPLKRFNYVDKYTKYPLPDVHQVGWIAQDVSGSLPRAIQSSSFTTWVNYTGSAITASDGVSIIQNGDRVKDVLAGSEVIEDVLTLDSDQIIKMMYGAIQKLQAKVEALEG